jgi:hypothetical protein
MHEVKQFPSIGYGVISRTSSLPELRFVAVMMTRGLPPSSIFQSYYSIQY